MEWMVFCIFLASQHGVLVVFPRIHIWEEHDFTPHMAFLVPTYRGGDGRAEQDFGVARLASESWPVRVLYGDPSRDWVSYIYLQHEQTNMTREDTFLPICDHL